MRSLLVAASLLFASFTQAQQAPAPQPTPQSEWMLIAQGNGVRFDILRSSVELDPTSLSVEYVFRTSYNEAVKSDKVPTIEGNTFVERVLLLCRENLYVTMSQLVYNAKNEHTATITRASVYRNSETPGTLLTETMNAMCAPYKKRGVTPDTKSRGSLTV